MDDADLKATMIASWDAGASGYDATPRHGIRYADEFVAWRRLVAAILGDPSHADVPARRVLDVGTGTGVLALLAAELGHDVVGVDLSAGMLAEARRKAADAGLVVDFRVGDAEALPGDLAGFDAVLARHVVWTLPHPDRAVVGWREAARPGGLVVIIDGATPRPRWPASWITAGAQRWVELRQRGRDEHGHDYPETAYDRLPLSHQRDTRAIESLLRGAGLERTRVRPLREVDRVERAHQGAAERLADGWRRYLATGRVPSAPS